MFYNTPLKFRLRLLRRRSGCVSYLTGVPGDVLTVSMVLPTIRQLIDGGKTITESSGMLLTVSTTSLTNPTGF